MILCCVFFLTELSNSFDDMDLVWDVFFMKNI